LDADPPAQGVKICTPNNNSANVNADSRDAVEIDDRVKTGAARNFLLLGALTFLGEETAMQRLQDRMHQTSTHFQTLKKQEDAIEPSANGVVAMSENQNPPWFVSVGAASFMIVFGVWYYDVFNPPKRTAAVPAQVAAPSQSAPLTDEQ